MTYPFPFYLTCIALLLGAAYAWSRRRDAWGIPAAMVLGTVAVWYVGDVLYNEVDIYLETIGNASLVSAWWQVLWFVVAFVVVVAPVHRMVNRKVPNQRSHVIAYLETDRLRRESVQERIDTIFKTLAILWCLLMAIALIRVEGDFIGLFAPYLGMKADPWGRAQIGSGFSAMISLAAYVQIFLAASFGVVAAMALNKKTRNLALLICALTLPYYIFDRTRNTMLATVIPGTLAFVFFRLKAKLPIKMIALGACFLLVNFWFTFVMANRQTGAISTAFAIGGDRERLESARHEGLNMFEELAWIDHFIETGRYLPNLGERYFAELVNPIPRTLWPSKPTIGLDYALARGQILTSEVGETSATISTGMIGQGVVNFGRIGGPLAAAILASLWVAMLARQDLLGQDSMRLILYGVGLVLTFNLGRDITLLVMYPFLFGLIIFLVWRKLRHEEKIFHTVGRQQLGARENR